MKKRKKIEESKQPLQEETGLLPLLHPGPGSLDANCWDGLHVGPNDEALWALMLMQNGPKWI